MRILYTLTAKRKKDMFLKITGFLYKDYSNEEDLYNAKATKIFVPIYGITFISYIENSEVYAQIELKMKESYFNGDDEEYEACKNFLKLTKGKCYIHLNDNFNVLTPNLTPLEFIDMINKKISDNYKINLLTQIKN